MAATVNLAVYREDNARLRKELAEVDARRQQLLRALQANESLIATALAPEQPLLPIEGMSSRASLRSTTRYGRAMGRKLKPRDRKVLRIIAAKGPIAFAQLQEETGINEWTLRDSIARL